MSLSNKKMNPLHFQVKKLQKLLLKEQDKFTCVQKKLNESETQRLELISQMNKETFSLSSQMTKLRSDYEQSQAVRQELEYQLAFFKNSLNKEKQIGHERDQISKEVIKKLEGIENF